MNQVFIGTSGWTYNHWKGVFYPETLPQLEWFKFYSGRFRTVEINATFYRLMPENTFSGWAKKAPDNFCYAVKMWRMITHRKYLKDCESQVKDFINRCKLLGKFLGPILIQLPPNLKINLDLLEQFVLILPRPFDYTIEFRNKEWMCDDVYNLLKKNKISFCIYDHPNIPCPKIITSDPVYIRFHGRERRYAGKYTKDDIEKWGEFIKDCLRNNYRIYAYFNNDYRGYAVENAIELMEYLNKK